MNPNDAQGCQKVVAAAQRIQEIIQEAATGCPNEDAKREIRGLLNPVHWSVTDPYVLEKAGEIETWADVLFSTRKWEKHGGVETVRMYVSAACSNMASRARTLLNETDQGE
jgi:hypothetical protein